MRRFIYLSVIFIIVFQSCATFSAFEKNNIAKTYYKKSQKVLGIYLPKNYQIVGINLNDSWQDWDYTFEYSIDNSEIGDILLSVRKDKIEIIKNADDYILTYYDPPEKLYEKWVITIKDSLVRINFIHF